MRTMLMKNTGLPENERPSSSSFEIPFKKKRRSIFLKQIEKTDALSPFVDSSSQRSSNNPENNFNYYY